MKKALSLLTILIISSLTSISQTSTITESEEVILEKDNIPKRLTDENNGHYIGTYNNTAYYDKSKTYNFGAVVKNHRNIIVAYAPNQKPKIIKIDYYDVENKYGTQQFYSKAISYITADGVFNYIYTFFKKYRGTDNTIIHEKYNLTTGEKISQKVIYTIPITYAGYRFVLSENRKFWGFVNGIKVTVFDGNSSKMIKAHSIDLKYDEQLKIKVTDKYWGSYPYQRYYQYFLSNSGNLFQIHNYWQPRDFIPDEGDIDKYGYDRRISTYRKFYPENFAIKPAKNKSPKPLTITKYDLSGKKSPELKIPLIPNLFEYTTFIKFNEQQTSFLIASSLGAEEKAKTKYAVSAFRLVNVDLTTMKIVSSAHEEVTMPPKQSRTIMFKIDGISETSSANYITAHTFSNKRELKMDVYVLKFKNDGKTEKTVVYTEQKHPKSYGPSIGTSIRRRAGVTPVVYKDKLALILPDGYLLSRDFGGIYNTYFLDENLKYTPSPAKVSNKKTGFVYYHHVISLENDTYIVPGTRDDKHRSLTIKLD